MEILSDTVRYIDDYIFNKSIFTYISKIWVLLYSNVSSVTTFQRIEPYHNIKQILYNECINTLVTLEYK